MNNDYDNQEGPWGSLRQAEEILPPASSVPASPNDQRKEQAKLSAWFMDSLRLSGQLNRKNYAQSILLPCLILFSMISVIIWYVLSHTELFAQTVSEFGVFRSAMVMTSQMTQDLSGMVKWLYNILVFLQYPAYWMLLAATIKRFRHAGIKDAVAWILILLGLLLFWPFLIIVALYFPAKKQ